MSFSINSEKVLKTMEKLLEASKVVKFDKPMVEHFMYVLFRQIKLGYNTYNVNSNDFYVLESFMNYNNIGHELKQFQYDDFIDDFIASSESIVTVDDLLNFLKQYFIFFHKTQKQEMNKFVTEFLHFASLLDGTEAPTLIQTPFLSNEQKVREVKRHALKYLQENDDRFNFFDITFHKVGADKGVMVNFHYLEPVDLDFVDEYITSIQKTSLRLHDFEIRYLLAIGDKNWNPKRSEQVHILGTNPNSKYSLILDNELIPRRHGQNVKGERISDYYNKQTRINKLHCREFARNYDEALYENKLILASQLHFSFEEYFDFLIERISQHQKE